MKLNTLLKTGLLTSTLTLSICQADKITLASFADWTAANSDGKIAYLNNALNQMNEKDTDTKHYRLVITEDVPGGSIFKGTKGEVYLSDTSGETSTSYYSAWLTSNTAYHHNLLTHKALLELYKTVLQDKNVEEQAINDSLDLLLPLVYNNVQASLQDLLAKDMKAEQLTAIVEHISKPNSLCIQAIPIEIPVPVETPVIEVSEKNVPNVQESSVSQGKKKNFKNPVINSSKIMELVAAGNARDEKAKKEAEILQNGGKKSFD